MELTYKTHLSMIGWLPLSNSDEVNGQPGSGKTIEALAMQTNEPGADTLYQVYYNDSGWSEIAANGAMCGTTGLRKKINGVKCFLQAPQNESCLEYRVYTDKWSDWAGGGFEFKSDTGFSAFQARVGHPQDAGIFMGSCVGRINAIAAKMNAKTYLEIGVRRGNTLFGVNIAHRTGVDPNFQLDLAMYKNTKELCLFDMPSDQYFAKMPVLERDMYKRQMRFDIIYIDGLHTYEQAMRDFLHSLMYSHAKTVWIFDDTLPSDPWSAIPDISVSYELRHLSGISGTPWHGDVYKCIFTIHDNFPIFSYATVIDGGNPQTVVWRTEKPARRERIFKDSAAIKSIGYFELLGKNFVLNSISCDNLMNIIGETCDNTESVSLNAIVNRLHCIQ